MTSSLFPHSPVGADHLAELGAVVPQMVYPHRIVSEEIVYLVYGITDNRTPYVTDMKRLGYVRRRILHYDRLAAAHVAAAVVTALFQHLAHYCRCELFLRDEHVHIGVDVLYPLKELIIAYGFRDGLCDERRRLSQYPCQLEARERIISHLAVSREPRSLPRYLVPFHAPRCGVQGCPLSVSL